ncbi:MAG: tetratricopeptide repeat protein [Phycisphaerae bacterium]
MPVESISRRIEGRKAPSDRFRVGQSQVPDRPRGLKPAALHTRLKAACWVCAAACLVLSTVPVAAQTSRPGKFDHEEMLKRAAEKPLIGPMLNAPDGKPLSDDQLARIRKSDDLMAGAEAARQKGDFAAAADRSREALDIRQEILGPNHYLTASADVLAETMSRWSKLPAEQQRTLAESDKQIAASKALYEKGDYGGAREAAARALSMRKAILSSDDIEVAEALLTLGRAETDLEMYSEAEKSLTRAETITRDVFGGTHPRLAFVLDRLGWLNLVQATQHRVDREKIREGVESLGNAVRIFGKTVGETPDMAESIDNLGTALLAMGNGRRALDYKLRALVIRRRILGPEAKDTGVSLSNLAWLYQRLGHPELVESLRTQALAVFKKSLGPDHPYCALEKGNLAKFYQAQRKPEKAVKLFEELVASDDKRPETLLNPDVVERYVSLGVAYLQAGRIDDAVQVFTVAEQRLKKLHDSGRKEAALNILLNMADVCQQFRLMDLTLKFRERIVQWDALRPGGEDDLNRANRLGQLGALYLLDGRLDDAKRVLIQAADRIRKVAGSGELKLAPALLSLAHAYEQMGDLDAAAKACDEAVRLSEARLGSRSLATAFAMLELGRINVLQKNAEVAKFLLEDARKTIENHKPLDPNAYLKLLQVRAHFHAQQGDRDKAIELLREALQFCHDRTKHGTTVNSDAATAETIKLLLDTSGPDDPALKSDYKAWRDELKGLLERLASKHAISSKERAWLKALGG